MKQAKPTIFTIDMIGYQISRFVIESLAKITFIFIVLMIAKRLNLI